MVTPNTSRIALRVGPPERTRFETASSMMTSMLRPCELGCARTETPTLSITLTPVLTCCSVRANVGNQSRLESAVRVFRHTVTV
jgi:hypothetical protein